MTRRSRLVTAALVPSLAVGLVMQAVNDADPPVTLSYLTVISALGLLVVSVWALLARGPRSRALASARGMVTTASLACGVSYLLLIAPREGGPRWLLEEPRMLVASLLLHVVTPVLAVVAFRTGPDRDVLCGAGRSRVGVAARTAAAWLAWPTAWLALALAADSARVVTMPYPFLRLSDVGWAGVLWAAAASAVFWWAAGMLLLAGPLRARREGVARSVPSRTACGVRMMSVQGGGRDGCSAHAEDSAPRGSHDSAAGGTSPGGSRGNGPDGH